MKIRHSLFFRFFLTLVALGTVPMAIASFFLVATYQSRVADSLSTGIARELLVNVGIQFVLIFIFVLIIATFAAYVVSRNIAQPLRILSEAARQIASGNLSLRIRVTRKDEIGALGNFFNEMVRHIKEAQERQEEASRVKSEFITVAAHQLRTPLSIMKWSHHTILDGDVGTVPQKQRELIEKAEIANEAMISLVHNLLDASRLEEGKFVYKFDRIDLIPFLFSIVEQKKLFAENKKVKVLCGQGITGELFIQADGERLAMAVGNIIDNGIRYTPSGGSVVIDLKQEENHVTLRVTDSGVGISPQDQEKLFTKFYRSPSVMHLETGGSGLGLYIARSVIASHGGDIWFESEYGAGTTFFIRLPKEGVAT